MHVYVASRKRLKIVHINLQYLLSNLTTSSTMTRPELNTQDRTKHGRYEQYTPLRLKFQFQNGTLRDRIKYFSIRGATIYLPYNYTKYHVQSAVQVILTLIIRWVMRQDSYMENKNICASHPQVVIILATVISRQQLRISAAVQRIAVVAKDIRSCTTYRGSS